MAESGRGFGEEHDVYGARHALAVGSGRNRAGTAFVLNLLMSSRLPGSDRYDREGGIRLQVGERELMDFFACLTGWRETLRLERRLPGQMKACELRPDAKEPEVLLVSLRTHESGRIGMVPVPQPDRVKLASLSFRAIMRNHGGVSQEVLYAMMRDIYRP